MMSERELSPVFLRPPLRGSSRSLMKLQSSPGDGGSASIPLLARTMVASPASSHTPAPGGSSGAVDDIDVELWLACAGLKSLPALNSRVYYLPQGHIEQFSAFGIQDVDSHLPRSNLPSVMPCILHDIDYRSDYETDDVSVTYTLCPTGDPMEEGLEVVDPPPTPRKKTFSFKKVLTPSDTSTHGGFSVPRRPAEECLPPLDRSQDTPSQELIAKDLHGQEWKFKHIYRGQPKRHLLTTGWSLFVSQKRLVANDVVIFLRDANGNLRIGVRRAPKPQQCAKPHQTLSPLAMQLGVLAAASHAANEKARFSVVFNPRTCPSEFVIPVQKYLKAQKSVFSVGQRFKMKVESEDPNTERSRPTGTVTGICDVDPNRWPNSLWRSLQVNFDEGSSADPLGRVSPWEIEPFTAPATQPPQVGARKRRRPVKDTLVNDQLTNRSALDVSHMGSARTGRIPGKAAQISGRAITPMEEGVVDATTKLSAWNIKREENFKGDSSNVPRRQAFEAWDIRRVEPSAVSDLYRGLSSPGPGSFHGQPPSSLCGSWGLRTLESSPFSQRKNQESLKLCVQQFKEGNDSSFDSGHTQSSVPLPSPRSSGVSPFVKSSPSMDPEIQMCGTSAGSRESKSLTQIETSWVVGNCGSHSVPISPRCPPVRDVNPSGWLSSLRISSQQDGTLSPTVDINDNCTNLSMSSMMSADPRSPQALQQVSYPWEKRAEAEATRTSPCDAPPVEKNCKLFGFSLPKENPASTNCPTDSSVPKVVGTSVEYTHGGNRPSEKSSAVSPLSTGGSASTGNEVEKQAVRPSKSGQPWLQAPVRSYTKVYKQGAIGRSIDVTKFDGYDELKRELELMFSLEGELDPRKGWQVVYTDHEEDVLLVGDDPWNEFCSCVRSIRLLSPSETSSHMGKSHGGCKRGQSVSDEDTGSKDVSRRFEMQDCSSPSSCPL